MPHARTCAAVLLIAAAALFFRAMGLDHRPMHGDEAVNAYKFGELLTTGRYVYDPHEFHGPSLYYLTLPVAWARGQATWAATNEATYRLVTVILSAGVIALLCLLADGLGRWATLTAAALLAVSPAMSFYGRYYIHETPLVFFTMLALAAGWRYTRTGHAGWAVTCGAALGAMHATKETCVIAFAAMIVALIVVRWTASPAENAWTSMLRRRHVGLALFAAAAFSILLFSAFFTHWKGPIDSIATYARYIHRAGGEGSADLHRQPWHYYLHMLLYWRPAAGPWFSEAAIVALALIGFVAAIVRRLPPTIHPSLARFVAFYTVFMTLVYSLIPYKTPWNLMGFLHGMTLLGGVGAAVIVSWAAARSLAAKTAAAALLLLAAAQLLHVSVRANTRFDADRRNPYVYAHPLRQVHDFAQRAEQVAALHPDGLNMPILLIGPDNWPLPFYLRHFSRVGGPTADVPPNPTVPLLIAMPEYDPALQQALTGEYEVHLMTLRPHVRRSVYIRRDLWQRFLESQK